MLYALRLEGLEVGLEAWKEGAGLALPSGAECIAAKSSRERLAGKSGCGSLLVDATASFGIVCDVPEGRLVYCGIASNVELALADSA